MARRFPTFSVSTAIVTGAASGIGLLEVERLRAAGVRVIGGDRNPQVETMRSGDSDYVGVAGDVADPSYANELVNLAVDRFGPVDLLFHSAGIMPGGRIADVDADRILDVMNVNYAGTVRMVKAVLPRMRARGRGQVVVLGSLTGYVPSVGFASYSASKSAVNAFTETLAHEEAAHGIQVLLVAPNAVKTPLLEQAAGGPKLIAKLATQDRSPMLSTPAKVLDDIEHALRRGRTVVLPGGVGPYLVRRLAPGAVWRLGAIIGG